MEEKRQAVAITVDIKHLILDGFSMTRFEQRRLQVAMQAELEQLLAADHRAARLLQNGTLLRAPAASFEYRPGQDAEQLGRQIAQAVYKGIGR